MKIAFLGPSLPRAEAAKLRFEVRGPARQGDVWKALDDGARVIALIDGVFESQPSVWHHELLDALDAGVAVFGGGSMGALRAAELQDRGMIGVGQVFRWYRDGVLNDDSDVALLHADASGDYRAFTVPHVNVVHAMNEAVRLKKLPRADAKAIVEASAAIFYQERTWPVILAAARLRPQAHARFEQLVHPDLKARDAREVLLAASQVAQGRAPLPREPRSSAHVRFRRIAEEAARLRARPDAGALEREGLRTLLLAGFARQQGLQVGDAERAAMLRRVQSGDAAERLRMAEDLALEELVLQLAPRLINDGPTPDEALVFAVRTGRAGRSAGRTSHGTAARKVRR